MRFMSALIFVLSANIDCLAVGLSVGIRAVKIRNRNIFMIALISSIGTFLSMKAGLYMSAFVFMKWANRIGAAILAFVSFMMLYQYYQEQHSLKRKSKRLGDYDENHSGEIEGTETIVLACGLALNNMGLGIGASITGIPIFISTLLTFMISFIFISLSQYLGRNYISQGFQKKATLLSAILILVLGIYELYL